MKPTEKRTSTQLGLGKVSGDARPTTKRTRIDVVDGDAPEGAPASVPPISAPPPSGGPISGAPVRQTRALETNQRRHTLPVESSPPDVRSERKSKDDVAAARVDRTPSPPPSSVRGESRPPHEDRIERIERVERVELDDDRSPGSVRGAPSSRTPIEVTQVDTKRIPRSSVPSKSSEGRFAAEEPTGRRPIAGRVRSDDRADPAPDEKQTGSRTVDGRPIGKRADSGRPESARPVSSRPVSGRPESGRAGSGRPVSGRPVSGRPVSGRPVSGRPTPSGRPTSGRPASIRPPGRASASPSPSPTPSPVVARSARPSIREDNFGDAVKGDAVGGSGRSVPKLLKTKAEIAAAPIDHRAGFLLAHIDGVTNVAGLVDICGMPEEELNEILDRLRRLGIVAVR